MCGLHIFLLFRCFIFYHLHNKHIVIERKTQNIIFSNCRFYKKTIVSKNKIYPEKYNTKMYAHLISNLNNLTLNITIFPSSQMNRLYQNVRKHHYYLFPHYIKAYLHKVSASSPPLFWILQYSLPHKTHK